MKNFFTYVISVFVISAVLTGAFWYYFAPKSEDEFVLISPLPEFLTLSTNRQVTLLDLWTPFIQQTYGSGFDASQITAKSALMYDLTTDKALFEKNPKERLPMASLTKVMTAIVSLENPKGDNRYEVKPEHLVGEDSMGLEAGEILTLEELLFGIMLPSGNDATEVLASSYPGGREAFLKAMNDKAKALGLSDTRFSNPSGLQGDGVQHTTTYDLLVITRYALENFPLFAEIVSKGEHYLPPTSTHKEFYLTNATNLVTTYPGVKGVKTGFTPEAGLCLITYIDYGGHRMIGILLNSENRRAEMKNLLDYSLKSVGVEPPPYEEPI
jgi:serine-type D-Ala-D-Ala carboxypeptidase (penicillin-binding protein 5/6)